MREHLYIPPLNASNHPLPSPNFLKNKILLRGKTLQTFTNSSTTSSRNSLLSKKKNSKNLEEFKREGSEKSNSSPQLLIDPNFGKLIALPSFKVFF